MKFLIELCLFSLKMISFPWLHLIACPATHTRNIQVFIAIGIGGEPSNPEKLFITPLDHISMYTEVFESHLIRYKRNPKQRFDDSEQLSLF